MHKKKKSQSFSPVILRKPRDLVRLLLFVQGGGICEFDGCNRYLMEHHVTLTEGNFAQMAHIVAFRKAGPRGETGARPEDINNVSNLMLLCPTCHKLIDDHPKVYTRQILEAYKKAHEDRIKHVTSLGADRKTAVIVFTALIGGQTVSVPFNQIVEATAPQYPNTKHPMTIDLTSIPVSDKAFLSTACKTIKARVKELFTPEGEVMRTGHVSVFALGPIPLLVYLGHQLTNKVSNEIYQRHRDVETWKWKTAGKPAQYLVRRVKKGRQGVSIILSLSGKISLRDLPKEIRESTAVYEITLRGQLPNPTFLNLKQDLDGFRIAYQNLMGQIIAEHGLIDKVNLFPAVPAPVAVLCGRELLPKVHPKLRVYDYDKSEGGFNFKLEV